MSNQSTKTGENRWIKAYRVATLTCASATAAAVIWLCSFFVTHREFAANNAALAKDTAELAKALVTYKSESRTLADERMATINANVSMVYDRIEKLDARVSSQLESLRSLIMNRRADLGPHEAQGAAMGKK